MYRLRAPPSGTKSQVRWKIWFGRSIWKTQSIINWVKDFIELISMLIRTVIPECLIVGRNGRKGGERGRDNSSYETLAYAHLTQLTHQQREKRKLWVIKYCVKNIHYMYYKRGLTKSTYKKEMQINETWLIKQYIIAHLPKVF